MCDFASSLSRVLYRAVVFAGTRCSLRAALFVRPLFHSASWRAADFVISTAAWLGLFGVLVSGPLSCLFLIGIRCCAFSPSFVSLRLSFFRLACVSLVLAAVWSVLSRCLSARLVLLLSSSFCLFAFKTL